ncbi:ATP-binding protein [Pelosinus sp. UFO1]|uniref:ATP-binding protein n=1 Tax=Pelosinus sp. UFO1 TaxID=484770 RepID=UPI0004D10FEF|nr:ATP-binding protein [Pelosinus sp. UFO1]AIF52683.1 putative anti-sigma regulatory factor, serine/threonine protein kinase [Pelosinus sp. UFO1]
MYSFSSLAEFATLRDSIKKELDRHCGEDALRLFLAINEGVNNAIFHGNKQDASKKVHLSMVKLPNEMKITIRDEGEGFLVSKESKTTELWQEDGRGINLIKHYVDSYWLNDLGNEVTFVKKINTV